MLFHRQQQVEIGRTYIKPYSTLEEAAHPHSSLHEDKPLNDDLALSLATKTYCPPKDWVRIPSSILHLAKIWFLKSDFPEICKRSLVGGELWLSWNMSYRFQRSSVWPLKTTSTENQKNFKVVENLHTFILRPRTTQSEIRSSRRTRFTEAKYLITGFRKFLTWLIPNLTILDVFDQATTLGPY